MKKVLLISLLAALAFTSCASLPSSKDVGKNLIEDATPDNSVLCYGISCEPNIYIRYEDKKNDWAADISTGKYYYSLPPCHQNATVVVTASAWNQRVNATTTNSNVTYINQYAITNDEWNFKTTKSPLHYIGYHSVLLPGMDTFEGMRKAYENKDGHTVMIGIPKTQEEYDIMMTKGEIKCLQTIVKKYKGTDWEPLINARIEELNQKL